MITIKSKGKFDKTTKFLNFLWNKEFLKKLDVYGEMGLKALESATPVDSGLTAVSWKFKCSTRYNKIYLYWINDNVTPDGTPIVILIEYGHSHDGYFVQGKDFINPAIQPVFDYIADDIWKEVGKA